MFTSGTSRHSGGLRGISMLAAVLAALASPARADTFTWTDAGTSWSTAADWFNVSSSTGTVPGALEHRRVQ